MSYCPNLRSSYAKAFVYQIVTLQLEKLVNLKIQRLRLLIELLQPHIIPDRSHTANLTSHIDSTLCCRI